METRNPTYAKIRNPRLTAQDLAWIWHNLDLTTPDEWETYDHHDHGADVGFTYHFHGVTIYVDGYCLREPWHGPEEIYGATLEDSLLRSYDLMPIIKEGRK